MDSGSLILLVSDWLNESTLFPKGSQGNPGNDLTGPGVNSTGTGGSCRNQCGGLLCEEDVLHATVNLKKRVEVSFQSLETVFGELESSSDRS